MTHFDLRAAINAISDVTQNRPQPLREFDQIYMKVADMVLQAEFLARKFDGLDVAFIGDGDSISLSALHLRAMGVIDCGPKSIQVLDFDERIVNSIIRFSEKYGFSDRITARLYNVADPLPQEVLHTQDAFYTNPPWGASNEGESVFIFIERGFEAVKKNALGMLVIADAPDIPWTQSVLLRSQRLANDHGFLVAEMLPEQHLYHLDDAPNLKSCSCVFRRMEPKIWSESSIPVDKDRFANFYGRNSPLKIHYVRARSTLNYGKAEDHTYSLEQWEG
ncbi:MAG: putative methyltransferase [Chloroflexi bacterium]|nr:MAG: putative methyltransferase [Chloroflexota bacterium]